jgi:hypothetical protein
MSSIYRKGRDGYFYYQTYLYNPVSKKKDKRIFHSLSTKDENKAKRKQLEFDKKYSKQKSSQNYHNILWYLKKKNIVMVACITITMSVLINHLYDNYKIKNQFEEKVNFTNKKDFSEAEIDTYNTISQVNSAENFKLNIHSKLSTKIDEDLVYDDIDLNFEIIRVVKLPGNFKQVKIYLVVKNDFNSKVLLDICEIISAEYSEFSNLVICLYRDDKNGQMLANGETLLLNNKERSKSWIAMYTFNPIEGVFFNDNPSGYSTNY